MYLKLLQPTALPALQKMLQYTTVVRFSHAAQNNIPDRATVRRFSNDWLLGTARVRRDKTLIVDRNGFSGPLKHLFGVNNSSFCSP